MLSFRCADRNALRPSAITCCRCSRIRSPVLHFLFPQVYRYWSEGRWNWVDSTSGVIQTLLYSEFFYSYLKALRESHRGGLPTFADDN